MNRANHELTYARSDAGPSFCPRDHRQWRDGCSGRRGGGDRSGGRDGIGTAHPHGTRVFSELVSKEMVDGTMVVKTMRVHRLRKKWCGGGG